MNLIKRAVNLIPYFGPKIISEYYYYLEKKRTQQKLDSDLPIKGQGLKFDPNDPLQKNFKTNYELLKSKFSSINRIIIWGLRDHYHSHRFIHRQFFDTMVKLDLPVLWLDDLPKNKKLVKTNDLIIAMDQAYTHMPLREDLFYCLHNMGHIKLPPIKKIFLQVFSNSIDTKGLEQWETSTYFDPATNHLFQAWGTDLLPNEFLPPVFNANERKLHWVGSIWNNEQNQGNEVQINELKAAIKKHELEFVHTMMVSSAENIKLIRESRIAPAIGSQFQVKIDYLPCRMFKNISYGQLGISNVQKFKDLYPFAETINTSIDSAVDVALSLDEKKYKELTFQQQLYTAHHQTYLNKLLNIVTAVERAYLQ